MKLPAPHLTDLWLTDSPAAWEALGFVVSGDAVALDGVTLRLGSDRRALGIDTLAAGQLDGVPTLTPGEQADPVGHPNGVVAVDHFVLVTPDFDRTADVFAVHGMPFKRIREVGAPGDPNAFRQGFRRLGPAILEVVESKQMPPGPARFWGVTMIARDLDALAEQLGSERLKPIKDAVQPGRRIATLDRSAGLKMNVAFMTPEPPRS